MSLLKNILGVFVELPENDNKTPPQRINKSESAVRNAQPKPEDLGASSAPVSGTAPSYRATDYHKHFEDLITEANEKNPLFQGTDYKEFTDSKSDLEAITDEATKYRTAFNVLKRTGLSKEKLLSTGREYINVIDSDLKAFDNAYKQQYGTDVENKESLLQQKAAELQALNEKITALQTETKELNRQVTENKDRLTANKKSFILAGENKKKEIQSELEKIQRYF